MTQTPQIRDALRMRELLGSYWLSQAIYAVAALGVADAVKDKPRRVADLAAEFGLDEDALARLLRTLAVHGFFQNTSDGFTLASMGYWLRSDVPGSLHDLALWNGAISYPAWANVLQSIKTGRPASRTIFGMQQFDFLGTHADIGSIFNRAMAGVGHQVTRAVLDAYDFSGFQRIADIGGGQGVLLCSILIAHPHLRGVLVEGPTAITAAREYVHELRLTHRCDVVEGDFFASVPPGYDAYILSSVLHDWNDTDATRILRQCRDAAVSTSMLLVIECMLAPSPNSGFAHLLDLQMLVMTGGRERTEAGYRTLIGDAGFRVCRIVQTGCPEQILEARPLEPLAKSSQKDMSR